MLQLETRVQGNQGFILNLSTIFTAGIRKWRHGMASSMAWKSETSSNIWGISPSKKRLLKDWRFQQAHFCVVCRQGEGNCDRSFFFVGDFGWVRHLGVAEDNRGVAFLVFLYIEKGIFFHIWSYIFAIECQIPMVYWYFLPTFCKDMKSATKLFAFSIY